MPGQGLSKRNAFAAASPFFFAASPAAAASADHRFIAESYSALSAANDAARGTVPEPGYLPMRAQAARGSATIVGLCSFHLREWGKIAKSKKGSTALGFDPPRSKPWQSERSWLALAQKIAGICHQIPVSVNLLRGPAESDRVDSIASVQAEVSLGSFADSQTERARSSRTEAPAVRGWRLAVLPGLVAVGADHFTAGHG